MSYLERISLALLILVATVTVLIRIAACNGQAESQPAPAAAESRGTVIVTADSVNLRQGPDRSASVLARVERGQELELLAIQDDWYNVRWGEGSLWLSKLYANPTEDCPAEQATAPEVLLRQLPGEWKGEIGGHPATFIFYTRNERLCAYVLYPDVKESLAVEASGTDTVALRGKRYERLAGTSGDFALHTFYGRLDDASERLSGPYSDTRNNQGQWYVARPGATSQEVPLSNDQPQLAEVPRSPEASDSAAAEPAAAESAEEPAASTPEPEPGSSFIGRWEGSGRQFSPRQRWSLEMEITSDTLGTTVGTISYPISRCRGELFLRAVDERAWTMQETITNGRCITGGSFTMRLNGRNSAQWQWYYAHGEFGAEGEVRRQGD